MGISVRTNNNSLRATRVLKNNSGKGDKTLEKLATGYTINRAADDASGLAVSEKMRAQITALDTYSDNSENGISLIQTAEGYLGEIHDMLDRMYELCIRAGNGIFEDNERAMIQEEIDNLNNEIDRISDTANFNRLPLFKGDTYIAAKVMPPKISGSLPGWVTFDAKTTASGTLAETYEIPGVDANGNPIINKHSASIVDFSSFSPSDISNSVGKGFYTTCCTCDAYYSFKFTDQQSSSVERSGRHYIYSIGIGNAQSAEDIYDAIISATSNGNPNNHYTRIRKTDDGKLMFYDERSGVKPNKAAEEGLFDIGIATNADIAERFIPGNIIINSESGKAGKIVISLQEISADSLGTSGISVTQADSSMKSAAKCKDAINIVSLTRAVLGAQQNRLEYTINDLDNASENLSAAKSRIKDTDIAKMMTEYTKYNVLNQSAQAMLAQANTKPQDILSLLQ